MDKIQQLRTDLESGKATLSEVQKSLTSFLFAQLQNVDVNSNSAERLICAVDNEFELVICRLKPDIQVNAALAILDKAEDLIRKGFDSKPNS
jgi:hypothetical protein